MYFQNDATRKTNLNAFLMCFDTGVAPAVGYTRTITAANVNQTAVVNDWALLEAQAAAGNIDLIVKGTVAGTRRGLVYQPVRNKSNYKSDKSSVGLFTHAQLQAKIAAGDTLSFTGVPPGSGVRMGIDRDLNGQFDGDQTP